jgi:hypothetical protein
LLKPTEYGYRSGLSFHDIESIRLEEEPVTVERHRVAPVVPRRA